MRAFSIWKIENNQLYSEENMLLKTAFLIALLSSASIMVRASSRERLRRRDTAPLKPWTGVRDARFAGYTLKH